jgi:hypothetical protein
MFDIVIMNMGGHSSNVDYLRDRLPHAKIVNWTDHLSTIRRGSQHIRTRYFWVISSCCDYSEFDFLWEPKPWQSHQIHCWPSGDQQFGDTFLIPTAQWNQQKGSLERLEQYQDVNFEHESVARLPWQKIQYNQDSVVDAIASSQCDTPYVLFEHENNPVTVQPDPWLWREQPVVGLTGNQASCLVPRNAHGSIRKQVYDYRYLEKKNLNPSQLLDIVFISNGEPNAEHNFKRLSLLPGAKLNRLVRVDNINGRAAAYHAAARVSTTPWFFAVFAKLEVDIDFDFSWQPDYMQQAKHYIFHARNLCNGLTYGHQAMIAYNRQLVLNNPGVGLDFTLDSPHEVIPIVSGIAAYNTSDWSTWRTAFREVLKLRASLPDVENEYRIQQWLKPNQSIRSELSAAGAQDALDYYDEVAGDFDQLKKSYEWEWLASYAFFKRQLKPNQ